jgi:hypothetical protein
VGDAGRDFGRKLFCLAQTNVNEEQGMKLYDSWHGGDLDSISMTNRGLVLHIPLISFPQRGNLDLSFFITHSTKQWSVKPARYDLQGRLITHAKWVMNPGDSTMMGARVASSLDWTIQGSSSYDDISGQSSWSGAISAPEISIAGILMTPTPMRTIGTGARIRLASLGAI